MRFLPWLLLLAGGCSIESTGLGGLDEAVPSDATIADAGQGDAPRPPEDGGAPAIDAAGTDSGSPVTEDGGTPELDAGPPPPLDAGPPPGTVIWQRTGPGYPPADFNHTTNIHFEGGEIHVPDSCRDLEIVTIADPASASWTDYSVSVARVRFDDVTCADERPSFTIVGRTVSREPTCAGAEGYACSIDFDAEAVLVGRRDASCGWVGSPVRNDTGRLDLGAQYSLTLEIDGNNLRCILRDGSGSSSEASTTDASMTRSAGGVAFIFDDVDARFGDPTVTAL